MTEINKIKAGVKTPSIVIAGATGNLGKRIAYHLVTNGASVKALVRKESDPQAKEVLKKWGVVVVETSFEDQDQLASHCAGANCFVSAVNGLDNIILDLQQALLNASIAAKIPRFIPSDYCIDYTKLPDGSNRNLDLRRRFSEILDSSDIKPTSILNGMFTDLLTGQAPVVLFGLKRVLYWGSKEQLLDFTTTENTALYTAKAALDPATPRYLRIAGDVLNAEGLRNVASKATGDHFKLMKAGGMKTLGVMIRVTRTIIPKKDEVFPPWQGMQYLHNMFSGLPKLEPLDNHRYTGIHWTKVEEVLSKHIKKGSS